MLVLSADYSEDSMTFDEVAGLIQKGGFSNFNYDSAQDFHGGSYATINGYVVMVTYPGAKGRISLQSLRREKTSIILLHSIWALVLMAMYPLGW